MIYAKQFIKKMESFKIDVLRCEGMKISKCQIEQALKEGRIKPEKIEETIEETINFQNKYSQISVLCRKIVGKKR